MSYKNTSYQRATSLTLNLKINEQNIFNVTFSLLNAFGTYNAISNADIQTMSYYEYVTRLTDFISFLENTYPDISISSNKFDYHPMNTSVCSII